MKQPMLKLDPKGQEELLGWQRTSRASQRNRAGQKQRPERKQRMESPTGASTVASSTREGPLMGPQGQQNLGFSTHCPLVEHMSRIWYHRDQIPNAPLILQVRDGGPENKSHLPKDTQWTMPGRKLRGS